MDGFLESLRNLDEARGQLGIRKKALVDKKAVNQARFEKVNAALIEDIADAERYLADVDSEVRKTALALWEESDKTSKKVGHGVTITETVAYKFDEAKALIWCVFHVQTSTLSLKKTPFKKLLKAGIDGFDYEIVTGLGVRIPSDLSKHLGDDDNSEKPLPALESMSLRVADRLGIDPEVCKQKMDELIANGCIAIDPNGTYIGELMEAEAALANHLTDEFLT